MQKQSKRKCGNRDKTHSPSAGGQAVRRKVMTYKEIQNEVIKKYRIDICDGTKCKNDWQRMHAHIRERRVCKWKQMNSIQCTFDLFHEIGHIETTTSKMRRCEEEYYATVWAIEKCKEYGLQIPEKTIELYQNYIYQEYDRGIRRGGVLPCKQSFRLIK